MLLEADDEGRLVCDPEQLRVTIFGYHPKVTRAVVEAALDDLETSGLLKLYADRGTRYAWFPSWDDHQRINRPTPSKLPPYIDSLNAHGVLTEHSSLIGEEGKGKEGRGRDNPSPRAEEAVRPSWGKPEDLVALYNSQTPNNVPAVEVLSEKRREKARKALRQYPAESWWQEVFLQYGRSKFLRGLVPVRAGHEGFRPDFDWLLSNGKNGVENYVKVHDGMYADS